MDRRAVIDELTFLLVRAAVVAGPAGVGYAVAGTLGLTVGFVVGLVAAAAFWSWTTASGARAAARTDLADATPGGSDGRQVDGPGDAAAQP